MDNNIESAREMLEAIAPKAVEKHDINKPLAYWANRLCDALESKVIDAELVNRCVEAIREHS